MKNILVTGCCGGMGSAICSLLIEKNYNVYGLDYKKNNIVEKTNFIECDITNTKSIEIAFEEVKSKVKSIDAIIHAAGIYDLDSLIEMDEERFLRIFNINLFGVYRINKLFTPLLNRGYNVLKDTSRKTTK